MSQTTLHPADLDPARITERIYVTRRRPRRIDAPLVLSLVIMLLLLFPARFVVPGMSTPGRPALLLAILLCGWWVIARANPRLVLIGPQPVAGPLRLPAVDPGLLRAGLPARAHVDGGELGRPLDPGHPVALRDRARGGRRHPELGPAARGTARLRVVLHVRGRLRARPVPVAARPDRVPDAPRLRSVGVHPGPDGPWRLGPRGQHHDALHRAQRGPRDGAAVRRPLCTVRSVVP